SKYMFFEYSDGEFKLKGEISKSEYDSWNNYFNRALYIGDYLYTVSGDRFVSADIETITEYDRVDF
ncbi:MAG: beta-propeller domain-containing protein, partial [Ruminococcus sp.]|nr:beta-propeller domain-containing protein [Ruminococcus sp.]